MKFETFTEFCERADEILEEFKIYIGSNEKEEDTKIIKIKRYIYDNHCFSECKERDELCKNKAFEWIMSYKYEEMNKNDLWSVRGQLKKGR